MKNHTLLLGTEGAMFERGLLPTLSYREKEKAKNLSLLIILQSVWSVSVKYAIVQPKYVFIHSFCPSTQRARNSSIASDKNKTEANCERLRFPLHHRLPSPPRTIAFPRAALSSPQPPPSTQARSLPRCLPPSTTRGHRRAVCLPPSTHAKSLSRRLLPPQPSTT
jgi:hypothetical protein